MSASRNRQPFRWSIPLGRIAGIRISLHVSFFLLVALVVYAEVQPNGLGLGGGLLWLAVIFACVLLHELAHSVVARSKGLVVDSIVLLPIGGVSQIEKMPEAWQDELAIAASGPFVSLALALLAAIAALAAGKDLLPVNLYGGALLPRTAWLNLVLGLFNLLPAFPLDGGRVFRALMERRGDVRSATVRASQLGRGLGIVMVVIGIFWNLWLVLIGVVVFLAATQEEASAIVHDRLHGLRVRQLMRSPVVTVDAGQAVEVLAGWWRGPQVVTRDGIYYGMIDTSEVDPSGPFQLLADVADRDVPVLAPDDDIGGSALDRLLTSGYRVLPVADNGTVVGVLVLDDVGSWLQRAA
jgi:Zn-dependent protease